MDIAGLVLTVVPMVAQTFNGYAKAADALSTFKRYSNVVTNLKMKVTTHEAIFRNSSEDLRSTIERYLSTMNEGQSSDAEPRTVDRLKTSLEACKKCLLEINDLLNIIRQKLEGFKTEGNEIAAALPVSFQCYDSSSIRARVAYSHWILMWRQGKPSLQQNVKLSFKECSGRFKLAWSKTRIDETIDKLRGMVQDYHIVSQQAIRFMIAINPNAERKPHQSNIKWSYVTKEVESMEEFKIIRQASTKLYIALAKHWLCRTHDRHRVNICSAKCSNDHCLSFEAVLAVDGSDETNGPICIGVESVDSTADKTTVTMESATTSSSKSFKGISGVFEPMQINSGSAFSSDAEAVEQDNTVELNILESAQAKATDLMKIQDFCQHFQQQYETMKSGKHLLGYLSEITEQRFYSLDPDRRVSGRPRSLADCVSSGKVLCPLSRLDSVGIAASLATCILQFYSTPWLPRSWSSKNVTFFRKESSRTDDFSPLHFSVQLEQKVDKGKGVEHTSVPSVAALGGPSVRNDLLFRFGVVLLETGLARPWDDLRREMMESRAIHQKSSDSSVDYHIADILAHTELLSHMGRKYSQIVRKCLGCDFGLGENNFDSEKLQAVFHRDVVEGLHALDSKLAEHRQEGTV